MAHCLKHACSAGATLAALLVIGLARGNFAAEETPFKITGVGTGPTGLPLPGDAPRSHPSTGTATHLGKYAGDGTVQTDFADFVPPNTLAGEFGSGTPYVFTAADGSKLVTWYGRTDHGAAEPGTFELTILGATGGGQLIVEALFIAEFVIQPDDSTGRFAGATGSWIMIAHTEPFVLGSSDPLAYWWDGEGRINLKN
ncbi:MAG TPA: hypothetical protein VNC50_12360 [Planctomycetia bacterium]|nr:hypothetical protein [Planctomycetia bacterium]